MLAERVVEWTRQWQEEGLEKGRQEGEAVLLIRLLERRFGPLEEVHRRRIAEADVQTLLEWGDRVLSVERLEDVLV